MIFRQLFDNETSTYTYLIADEHTREAAIIDPVREQVERDLQLLEELDLKLVYTLETHVHADHVTASGALREKTGARSVVSKAAGVRCADVLVGDGDRLKLGKLEIEVIATPGHTSGCVTYSTGDRIFTGDALLIRGCGRTDFQSGSADQLYDSVKRKLFVLPKETLVFPGHDYKGRTVSTIGEERQYNPRLAHKKREEFVAIMKGLNLAKPKKIDEAVPANLGCGVPESVKPEAQRGQSDEDFLRAIGAFRERDVFEIDPPSTAKARAAGARIIDVRSRSEFDGELGHLPDAELVPLERVTQEARRWDPHTPIVTVCRSGNRSATAAKELEKLGFDRVVSLRGGMLAVRGAQ